MKLLSISFGTVFIAALIWTTLWLWSGNLTYKPYEHPLMSWVSPDQKPVLALSTNNLEQAQKFLAEHPDGVLEVTLKTTKDSQFFVAPDSAFDFIAKLPKENIDEYQGNKYHFYTYEYLKKHVPDMVLAEEWLKLSPRFWIFNVEDNVTDTDIHVVDWIEKNKLQDKAIITSDVDLIVSATKERRPLWIYGSSQSDLAKLLSMASINLTGLVNFKRDYFITPATWNNRDMLNAKVVEEMRKRFKKVVIGPVHTDQDRGRALKLNPDVLILSADLTLK
jgi:hypothetical protein